MHDDDGGGLSDFDRSVGAVCRLWTERTGADTNAAIGDSIAGYLEDGTPREWLVSAIELTATAGVRRWSYAAKILERWKSQGHADNGETPPAATTSRASVAADVPYIAAAAKQNLALVEQGKLPANDPRIDQWRREAAYT